MKPQWENIKQGGIECLKKYSPHRIGSAWTCDATAIITPYATSCCVSIFADGELYMCETMPDISTAKRWANAVLNA
jgi:hypothetical protein